MSYQGRVICVTGHRPDKLGGYDSVSFAYLVACARMCLTWHQPAEVLTGMALGWDTAIAVAAFELSVSYRPCIPFKGQECRWRPEQQALYWSLINSADRPPVYVSEPPYAAWKMETRNRYMVDNSHDTAAMWNGDEKGGTANCVRYATQKGRQIMNWWDRLQDLRAGRIDVREWQSEVYRVC